MARARLLSALAGQGLAVLMRALAFLAFWRAGRQAAEGRAARRAAAARRDETRAVMDRPRDRDRLVERLRRDGL